MNSRGPALVPPPPLDARIHAFAKLGEVFGALGAGTAWPGHGCGLAELEYRAADEAVLRAGMRNAWFTEENVRHMLRSLGAMLRPETLTQWVGASALPAQEGRPVRTVGIITAGNIPLVGFHDLLSTLVAGHKARVRVSSEDAGLTAAVVDMLRLLSPDLGGLVEVMEGRLGDVDAVIATGSNNTARYFEHYFAPLPHIIRRNRTSVAVLEGTETPEELAALGEDLFRYFGLGCRNVGKLYLPADFDLDRIIAAILPWGHLAQHSKWANNYDYHKAIWLMDRVPLIENGFVLFKEDQGLHSPLGSIYYERYTDRQAVNASLASNADRIQCVVGHGHVPFGQAQCPLPWDYADGVDTLAFLAG
jgi:hypothetical protein